MKKLESKLYKFEKQRVESLAKILGGETQNTKYDNGDHCGHDTINEGTADGPAVTLNGQPGIHCDFVDLTKAEIVSAQPR